MSKPQYVIEIEGIGAVGIAENLAKGKCFYRDADVQVEAVLEDLVSVYVLSTPIKAFEALQRMGFHGVIAFSIEEETNSCLVRDTLLCGIRL